METLQNNPLLQGFRFKFIGSNITINGNETWPLPGFPPSGNAYINGNLTVSAGAQLHINSGRIQFAPTAELIVQPSGRLFLSGTLTSWCDYWQGVRVQGNAGAAQSLTTHGFFQSTDHARVENAVVGVASLDGGIVDANKTTFHNNNLGSAIGSYGFPHIFSKFGDCLFETTIKDKFTTPGFGGRSHLLLLGVKNQFLVAGCDFNNAYNTSMSNPTIFGILSFLSGFKVDGGAETLTPSHFNNLTYGIYSAGDNTSGINIKNSIFKDCNVGIYGMGAKFFAVTDNNTFNMGGLPYNTTPYSLPDQFGVWFKDPFPILSLSRNTFRLSTATHLAPDYTIGSFAQNTGDFNNLFSQNKYNQIDFANLANENNGDKKGLHYLCNENFGPQVYDFAIEQDASIRQDQGEVNFITGGFNAASNTFSYSNGNNGDLSDFYNEGGGIIKYYWRNSPNEEPLDYLGILKFLSNSGASCADREICPEPCKTPTEFPA